MLYKKNKFEMSKKKKKITRWIIFCIRYLTIFQVYSRLLQKYIQIKYKIGLNFKLKLDIILKF